MEVQSPQHFLPSTSLQPIFCATHVYALYQRAQDGFDLNDSLYHSFLKWKLKCENILDCELAMLPEEKKCKKVIAWSEDFCMDQ